MRKPWPGSKRCSSKITDDEGKDHIDMELLTSPPETLQEELQQARENRYSFSNRAERTKHIRLFLAWLPSVLRDAPSIEWDQLPSQVMGHLVRTVGDHPDAIPIALAVGCAAHAMKRNTLVHVSSMLLTLCRHLRAHYGMTQIAQLQGREIWMRFVTGRQLPAGEVRLLTSYASVTAGHLRTYLEHLDERHRLILEAYAFPLLPARFLELHAQHKASVLAAQARRKEQSDVLTPLLPLLIELAQFRKQAMERLYTTFCGLRDQVEAGAFPLPHQFQYVDRAFSITEDAPTIAAVSLVERTVTLNLTLWNRDAWVEAHPELYGRCTHWQRKRQLFAYAAGMETYFLQYEGDLSNLLWCGEILRNWPMLPVFSSSDQCEDGQERLWQTLRPGLLAPPKRSSVWFRHAMSTGAVLFEPVALYRGVLYATALATLALTNGSRVSELLQVSATRFETIVVDEIKQQQPTGRKIGLLVQKLLPKGYTQESERQLFLIGEMAGRHLREIGQLLESVHGGTIPVVEPTRSTKSEDLLPEPYLFQWGASPDGRLGLLDPGDVGLIPEATAYYSRLPTARLLALLFEAQSTLTVSGERTYLQAPSPRTLEQMDEALREIFEQWSLLGPTVLGFCSAGLCVRPNNRALCLGCRFLVPHYSSLPHARSWRKLYVLHAEQYEAHGHTVDAKQARELIQYLDDIITIMQIQIRARQDGRYLPFADTLFPNTTDEEENDGNNSPTIS